MKKKLRCLFLGYDNKKTKLISTLKKKNCLVKNFNGDLNRLNLEKYDFCISFGYRKIINKENLKKFKRKPINLHLSYLPYNRGAHPIFWSLVENTPSGVTIHEISNSLDKGKILFQKKVKINKRKHTFKSAYDHLFRLIENLFIKHVNSIISKKYHAKKQVGKGSFHFKLDLPKSLNTWNFNIAKFIAKQKKLAQIS